MQDAHLYCLAFCMRSRTAAWAGESCLASPCVGGSSAAYVICWQRGLGRGAGCLASPHTASEDNTGHAGSGWMQRCMPCQTFVFYFTRTSVAVKNGKLNAVQQVRSLMRLSSLRISSEDCCAEPGPATTYIRYKWMRIGIAISTNDVLCARSTLRRVQKSDVQFRVGQRTWQFARFKRQHIRKRGESNSAAALRCYTLTQTKRLINRFLIPREKARTKTAASPCRLGSTHTAPGESHFNKVKSLQCCQCLTPGKGHK